MDPSYLGRAIYARQFLGAKPAIQSLSWMRNPLSVPDCTRDVTRDLTGDLEREREW